MKKILIAILCLCSIFLLACQKPNAPEINTPEINVPIYTGMSVSKNNVVQTKGTTGKVRALSFMQLDEEYDYTATVGDVIYINIHIDNPDEYEIVSLKLNGTKYVGNYQQFEEGTTAENVIIKINVGDTPTIKEFTVSEIKWINGTTIEEQSVVMKSGIPDTIYVKVNAVVPTTPLASGKGIFGDNTWYNICFSKVTMTHEFIINSISFSYNGIEYVLDASNCNKENEYYLGWIVDLSGRVSITFDFDYRLIGATEWTNRVVTETHSFDFY